MAKTEYELISHDQNFRIFLVNILYRTPHYHKDYEINLILDGAPTFTYNGVSYQHSIGDIIIVNPFQSHEIAAEKPCLILSLQISSALFSSYLPEIDFIEFEETMLERGLVHVQVRGDLLTLAQMYYEKPEYAGIQMNLLINRIFLAFLQNHPHRRMNHKELSQVRAKGQRMREIMRYIDEHYTEKLLLTDIAREQGLDLYYLSHFFKETFGITFQNYLTKVRCEHARQLLLLSDHSLLDISVACGFSDPKYFNKGFREQYGCTPKEYRKNFAVETLPQQQKSLLTTQEVLSDRSAIVTLDRFLDRG